MKTWIKKKIFQWFIQDYIRIAWRKCLKDNYPVATIYVGKKWAKVTGTYNLSKDCFEWTEEFNPLNP